MLRYAPLVAVAVGLSLFAGRALAQSVPLDAALLAYSEGRLDEALASFEQALAAPGNEPGQLTTIHLHLGILRASLGDADGARNAFEVAIALRPDLEAPTELGPGQRAPFDDARAARDGRRLRVETRARGPATIEARVMDAPAGLIGGIAVLATLRDGTTWTFQIAGERGAATIPNGARDIAVRAVDAHGGVVVRAESVALQAVPTAAEAARRVAAAERAGARGHDRTTTGSHEGDRDDGGGGFFSTPWPWIGLGAILIGAAVAAIVVVTAQDEYVVGAPVIR